MAEGLFREILAIDGNHRESLEHLVMICLQSGRPGEAEQHLRQLAGVFPDRAIYSERLATLLERRGRPDEAIASYDALLRRNPGLTASRYNLARLLKRAGHPDRALREYRQCLRGGIERPEEVHANISVICTDLQRHDEAREALQAALAINPDYIPALYNLAQLEEESGDWAGAHRLFDRILQLDPTHSGALARIANGQKISDPVDPLIRRLKRALRRDSTPSLAREELLYALGKVHDDCGQYARAMDYYRQANSLGSTRCQAYHPAAQEELVDRVIATCDARWLQNIEPVSSRAHIFICGMFRSGTTLVEQILAAHPALAAGGEIDHFQREARPFPTALLAMDPAQLRSLGADYDALVARAFPGAERVTNKRPDNFLCLGLISSLFPNACIINTLRQPLDNCLSLFFQPLDARLGYANNLEHAGHYYLQYRRLMQHWQPLVGDRMLSVDYETLVAEPRQAIAGILSFLQLDWRDDCLQFHQLRNRVRTASLHQVRQPLHQGSVSRWRHYADALESLRKDLQRAGVLSE